MRIHQWRTRSELETKFELLIVAAALPWPSGWVAVARHALQRSRTALCGASGEICHVLSVTTLYLTLAVPAWLAATWSSTAIAFVALPLALLVNATVAWLGVQNAVPSESIHDIVGSAQSCTGPDHMEVACASSRFTPRSPCWLLEVSFLPCCHSFHGAGDWSVDGSVVFAVGVTGALLGDRDPGSDGQSDRTHARRRYSGAAALLAMAGLLGFLPGCLAQPLWPLSAADRRRSLGTSCRDRGKCVSVGRNRIEYFQAWTTVLCTAVSAQRGPQALRQSRRAGNTLCLAYLVH